MTVLIHKGERADVTLLLEGTYPFIHGGVSSWVHQMINGLSEFRFSLVFIGGSPENYDSMKYELPGNVVHLETHYLMEGRQAGLIPEARRGNPEAFADVARMHDALREKRLPDPAQLMQALQRLGCQENGITHADFLYSEQAWEYIRENYRRRCTDPSFVDYFWTIRTMHAPIFVLDRIARHVPDSRFFHTISTGYAGFLGALIAMRRRRRLLISEHGIYTKERKIDLAQAEWISDRLDMFSGGINSDISYMRQLWTHFFEGLGRVGYKAASRIISLYEGNRQRQIQDGAEAEKTSVIPNGIRVERFLQARRERTPEVPMVAALVGRVVPIKDIKTFIRAMHIVCDRLPEAEGWIVGPDDEDAAYADECRALARNMGLEENIRFLGMQKVDEIFPKIGVNVLTSISEALPLVLLEGFASGVPAVATEVGACRELICGSGDRDEAIGVAGEVVSIANPEATGAAIIALLSDPERWRRAQQAGIERVEAFYTEAMLFDAYRALYREMMADDSSGEAGG